MVYHKQFGLFIAFMLPILVGLIGLTPAVYAQKQSPVTPFNFSLNVSPFNNTICTPSPAVYTIQVLSSPSHHELVNLSLAGAPVGVAVTFNPGANNAPFTSTLTIDNTVAASPGLYPLVITGSSPTDTISTTVGLHVFTAAPAAATLLAPADEAADLDPTVTFSWTAAAQTEFYQLEVATDPAFTQVVYTLTTADTTATTTLSGGTHYYWRVLTSNSCGNGPTPAVFEFSTLLLPGECTSGQVTIPLLNEGFETGAPGWTTGGTNNNWGLSSDRSHSGTFAYQASAVSFVSDQHLISPAVHLPAGHTSYALHFWNYQHLESGTGQCFDGGVIEITTNGSTWLPLESELLTFPYDGPVNSASNPLNGRSAWCGDPQDWHNPAVDLTAFADETIQLRYRLGTDNALGREGWYVDDVRVQACAEPVSSVVLAAEVNEIAEAAGQTVTYTLHLTNTGTLADNYNLSTAGANWPVTLSATNVTLAAGATATFSAQVEIPAGAQHLDTDVTAVTALSTKQPAISATVQLTTTALVTPVYGVELSPAQSITAPAGETVTYTVWLTNTGNTADVYELEAHAVWVTTVASPTVALAAGETVGVWVTVAIPPTAADQESDVAHLIVTSTTQTGVNAQGFLTTTAILNPEYGVELSPAQSLTSTAGAMLTYTLTVTNNGNVNSEITLQLDSSWVISSSATSLNLAPNEAAEVWVWVQIPLTATAGMSDTAVVTATIGSDPVLAEAVTQLTSWVRENQPAGGQLFLPVIYRP